MPAHSCSRLREIEARPQRQSFVLDVRIGVECIGAMNTVQDTSRKNSNLNPYVRFDTVDVLQTLRCATTDEKAEEEGHVSQSA